MTLKAVFLKRPGELETRDIPEPECGPDMVKVRIKEVGLCGSDVHYFNHGRVGKNVVVSPHILGHESSGIVTETGKKVRGLQVGHRVSIEPGVPCRACKECLTGYYNLCKQVVFMGAPPNPGTFREYVVHDPLFVHTIPDTVTFTQGALVEPLSVAYNVFSNLPGAAGGTILIIGAGPIGLAGVEMAMALGVGRLLTADVDPRRLEKARELGADRVFNPAGKEFETLVEDIPELEDVDHVIEASGSEAGIRLAINAAGRKGKLALVGMGSDEISIPYMPIIRKEIRLFGTYRYANAYPSVIRLLTHGNVKGEPWVTHRFSLDDLDKGFAAANDKQSFALKIMIEL